MKKLAIFFAIIIIIVCGVSYIYLNYKANYFEAKKSNIKFESYLNKEILGTDLATIINKAIDNNVKNEVIISNNIYEDDNANSICIDIKIIDNNKTYKMEDFYNNGIQNFIEYYGNIKFKCVDIKYHKSTNKVKYMLFEQMT